MRKGAADRAGRQVQALRQLAQADRPDVGRQLAANIFLLQLRDHLEQTEQRALTKVDGLQALEQTGKMLALFRREPPLLPAVQQVVPDLIQSARPVRRVEIERRRPLGERNPGQAGGLAAGSRGRDGGLALELGTGAELDDELVDAADLLG